MNLRVLASASTLAAALLSSNGCGGASYVGDLPAEGGDAGKLPDGRAPFMGGTCPASKPSPASQCTTEGLSCAYGKHLTGCESDSATCSRGTWAVFSTPACPLTKDDGGTKSPDGGTDCEIHGGTCMYDDGTGFTDVCTGSGHTLSSYPCGVAANKMVCCLP